MVVAFDVMHTLHSDIVLTGSQSQRLSAVGAIRRTDPAVAGRDAIFCIVHEASLVGSLSSGTFTVTVTAGGVIQVVNRVLGEVEGVERDTWRRIARVPNVNISNLFNGEEIVEQIPDDEISLAFSSDSVSYEPSAFPTRLTGDEDVVQVIRDGQQISRRSSSLAFEREDDELIAIVAFPGAGDLAEGCNVRVEYTPV